MEFSTVVVRQLNPKIIVCIAKTDKCMDKTLVLCLMTLFFYYCNVVGVFNDSNHCYRIMFVNTERCHLIFQTVTAYYYRFLKQLTM